MSKETIADILRTIPDFPKPGINFIDITPLLQDPKLFAETIDLLSAPYMDSPPDYIAGIESRGFIFGAAMALKLGCGFVPVRKQGKLPAETIQETYDLEYGTATIEIHSDALKSGDKVVLVDDLLATGGTVTATANLIKKLGAEIEAVEFVVELAFLNGREKLPDMKIESLVVIN